MKMFLDTAIPMRELKDKFNFFIFSVILLMIILNAHLDMTCHEICKSLKNLKMLIKNLMKEVRSSNLSSIIKTTKPFKQHYRSLHNNENFIEIRNKLEKLVIKQMHILYWRMFELTCWVKRRVKKGIKYLTSIRKKPRKCGFTKFISYSSSVNSERCSESTVSPWNIIKNNLNCLKCNLN